MQIVCIRHINIYDSFIRFKDGRKSIRNDTNSDRPSTAKYNVHKEIVSTEILPSFTRSTRLLEKAGRCCMIMHSRFWIA